MSFNFRVFIRGQYTQKGYTGCFVQKAACTLQYHPLCFYLVQNEIDSIYNLRFALLYVVLASFLIFVEMVICFFPRTYA